MNAVRLSIVCDLVLVFPCLCAFACQGTIHINNKPKQIHINIYRLAASFLFVHFNLNPNTTFDITKEEEEKHKQYCTHAE